MKKRGQVTVFAVMGLILIIIASLFLYVHQSLKDHPDVEKELDFTYEQSLVKNHVESCVARIAEEGLRKLGANGGYINPHDYGFIALEDFPTSSSALQFSPGSDYILPYWDYMKSSNACTECYFDSEKPPIKHEEGLRSVEYQICTNCHLSRVRPWLSPSCVYKVLC